MKNLIIFFGGYRQDSVELSDQKNAFYKLIEKVNIIYQGFSRIFQKS